MAPPGMEEMQEQLSSMFANLGGQRTRPRKLKVKEAQKLLVEEEAGKLVNEEELRARALANAEQQRHQHREDRPEAPRLDQSPAHADRRHHQQQRFRDSHEILRVPAPMGGTLGSQDIPAEVFVLRQVAQMLIDV
jgi:hypothetical protein